MHNAALADMARHDPRFATWKYFCFEVPPAELPDALGLFHERKFRGINLTVPHKILAVAHLAGIDPAAKTVGAVNTLRWTERGWFGHNTDGHGLAMGLREDLQNDLAGRPVILLGAGGAARGAAVECLRRGCASLWIGGYEPARPCGDSAAGLRLRHDLQSSPNRAAPFRRGIGRSVCKRSVDARTPRCEIAGNLERGHRAGAGHACRGASSVAPVSWLACAQISEEPLNLPAENFDEPS